MNSLFAQDSPLMRFLTRIADLVLLNLMFVVTSIPLFTIGAGLTAMNYTAMKLTKDECEGVIGTYWASFRSNFKQSTQLWGVVFFFGAVLTAWFIVGENSVITGAAKFFLYLVLFAFTLQYVLATLFVFPYAAKFEGSTREILRNSIKLGQRHPIPGIAMLLVTGLPIVITIFYPAMVAYGLLWLGIGFAAIAFVNAYLYSAIFERYIPKPDAAT